MKTSARKSYGVAGWNQKIKTYCSFEGNGTMPIPKMFNRLCTTKACGRRAAFLYHNDQSSEIDDIVVWKTRQKKLTKQPS